MDKQPIHVFLSQILICRISPVMSPMILNFPTIKPITAPFGQPVATLLNQDLPCWQNTPDFAVVWTRPQSVVPAFKALLKYEQVPLQKMLQQVDEYCCTAGKHECSG